MRILGQHVFIERIYYYTSTCTSPVGKVGLALLASSGESPRTCRDFIRIFKDPKEPRHKYLGFPGLVV